MTTHMVRKQIYIHKRQNALLKCLSQARGVSEAEIIRQAIDREISGGAARSTTGDRTAWEEFEAFQMARRELGITGEPLRWNRQEIYDERESRWIHPEDQE
jgi:hypothetical protein